jgi:hypothetical protein
MSAAATATTTTTTPETVTATTTGPTRNKAVQDHIVRNLAALAMILDEDHIEELILTLFRDNDMVGLIYRRDAVSDIPGDALDEVYDAGEIFEIVNNTLWEKGRQIIAGYISRKAIESTIPASAGAGAGAGAGAAAIHHM